MEISIDDYNQNVKALQGDVIQLLDGHFQSVPEAILVHEVTTIMARYFAQVLTLREKENSDWTTKETSEEVQSWVQGATAHALLSYQKDGILQPLYQEPLFTGLQNKDRLFPLRIIDGGKE